jgi:hypothetical protein
VCPAQVAYFRTAQDCLTSAYALAAELTFEETMPTEASDLAKKYQQVQAKLERLRSLSPEARTKLFLHRVKRTP